MHKLQEGQRQGAKEGPQDVVQPQEVEVLPPVAEEVLPPVAEEEVLEEQAEEEQAEEAEVPYRLLLLLPEPRCPLQLKSPVKSSILKKVSKGSTRMSRQVKVQKRNTAKMIFLMKSPVKPWKSWQSMKVGKDQIVELS